jgi:phosphomannomutase
MGRKFFGTDGIRGRTNQAPMTADVAMRVGQAAGTYFLRGVHRHRVVIGKDTRLSGYMMESAMVAGFTSVGMDVVLLGPMPTPAVAMLTRDLRADLGVMISASHNPFADNGIKLFGPDGYKLSDKVELEIERLMEQPATLIDAPKIGRAKRIDDARGRYVQFAKSAFPVLCVGVSKQYEIYSGRRKVSVQYSVSPLQAVVDYARNYGSADDEIQRLGVDCVSWRGAQFRAVLVPEPEPAA